MPRRSKAQLRADARKAVSQIVDEAVKERVEEETGRVPGKVVHGVKTTWTEKDVWNAFGGCMFVPAHTMPVRYNGVRFQLLADRENHVPTIIRDIYLGSIKKSRMAGRSIPNVGFETTVAIGAGGLPPEEYREV